MFSNGPTHAAIEEVRAVAEERAADGGQWPGMTYEQGVADALAWVVGDREDNPLHEED